MRSLSENERAIIDCVAVYHVLDVFTCRELFYAEASEHAARKALDRLTRKRWLNRWPLGRRKYYFTLSRGACNRFRLPHRLAESLTYRPLVRAYGTLWFCHRAGQNLMTPREWAQTNPHLHRPRLPANSYYYDEDRHQVGWIHVDLGGRVENLERRLRNIVATRRKLLERLIDCGQFHIDVVVASFNRALLISKANVSDVGGIPVVVHVIPELRAVLLTRG